MRYTITTQSGAVLGRAHNARVAAVTAVALARDTGRPVIVAGSKKRVPIEPDTPVPDAHATVLRSGPGL